MPELVGGCHRKGETITVDLGREEVPQIKFLHSNKLRKNVINFILAYT